MILLRRSLDWVINSMQGKNNGIKIETCLSILGRMKACTGNACLIMTLQRRLFLDSAYIKCVSLHAFICSKIGTKLSANSVRVYSTLGGIS